MALTMRSNGINSSNLEALETQLLIALEKSPKDPLLWVKLAGVRRGMANFQGAEKAIQSALAIDPRFFLALLMKGSLDERRGDLPGAARNYGAALTQAPPSETLDVHTRNALVHAAEINQKYVRDLRLYVQSAIAGEAASSIDKEVKRINFFLDTALGIKRRYVQEPTEYFYPGMPTVEFYERDEFPWLAEIEAATGVIRDEMLAVLNQGQPLEPYITYPAGVPLDQWRDLNHSLRWSAFHFYNQGKKNEKNCSLCPQTANLLSQLPQPEVTGRMPAAMFSVLRPHTKIPPHTGAANVRLVMHLPLVVPSGCGFRVGNETREWVPGQAWVFDDTIEHEAWNNSDKDRVVLICDVWNPRLSAEERKLIAAVMRAMDRFNSDASVSV